MNEIFNSTEETLEKYLIFLDKTINSTMKIKDFNISDFKKEVEHKYNYDLTEDDIIFLCERVTKKMIKNTSNFEAEVIFSGEDYLELYFPLEPDIILKNNNFTLLTRFILSEGISILNLENVNMIVNEQFIKTYIAKVKKFNPNLDDEKIKGIIILSYKETKEYFENIMKEDKKRMLTFFKRIKLTFEKEVEDILTDN